MPVCLFMNVRKLRSEVMLIKLRGLTPALNFLSRIKDRPRVLTRADDSKSAPNRETSRAHPTEDLRVDVTVCEDTPECREE